MTCQAIDVRQSDLHLNVYPDRPRSWADDLAHTSAELTQGLQRPDSLRWVSPIPAGKKPCAKRNGTLTREGENEEHAIEICYDRDERVVPVSDSNVTILDTSIEHKIPHVHECGGHARCTTCLVRILDGIEHVSPRSPAEAKVARDRGWDPYIRLACQTKVSGPVTLQRLIRTGSDVNGAALSCPPGF